MTLRRGIGLALITLGAAGLVWFLRATWTAFQARHGICGTVADCPVNWTDTGLTAAAALLSGGLTLAGARMGFRS